MALQAAAGHVLLLQFRRGAISAPLWALCLPAEGPALWDVLKFSFDPE